MSEFEYTYSAPEQEEIKRIREKYIPKEENKMDQLRRLDAQVTRKGTVMALVVGIIGSLVLGTGMSLCMTDLGAALGAVVAMVLGIAVGLAGIVLVALAYPIYNKTLQKERKKIAPEILQLTEELMQ